jgi:gluconate 2-dehydrogenase gamma chain
MKRREFITLSMTSLGGVLVYTLARDPMWMNTQEGTIRVPLRFFKADEAHVISAASERIFPSDESGPGAREAGVVIYIDHQLAGPYGRDEFRYTKGPFVESDPEHGYQGKENPQEIYRAGIMQLGDDFVGLTGEQQDERLRAIEQSLFFQMLRAHTVEGMFCDPMHGGNANLIGWQMIGFPGPLMSYREQIGVYNRGEAWRVKPKSLEQVLGRSVKGSEEENVK